MKMILRKVHKEELFHGLKVKEGFYVGTVTKKEKEFFVCTSGMIKFEKYIKLYLKMNGKWDTLWIESNIIEDVKFLNIPNHDKNIKLCFIKWFGEKHGIQWKSYIKKNPDFDINKIMEEYDEYYYDNATLFERKGE